MRKPIETEAAPDEQAKEPAKPKPHLLPNRILRLPAVMEATGLKKASIYVQMSHGGFPRAIPLGGRAVGWRAVDVDRWCEERFQQAQAS